MIVKEIEKNELVYYDHIMSNESILKSILTKDHFI